MLAGDLITRALRRGNSTSSFDLGGDPTSSELQGGTDPGNAAEFLAFEVPFEVEPATGLIFPAEVERG